MKHSETMQVASYIIPISPLFVLRTRSLLFMIVLILTVHKNTVYIIMHCGLGK